MPEYALKPCPPSDLLKIYIPFKVYVVNNAFIPLAKEWA